MKIKEVNIGVATTINLGNFNSLRIEAHITAEVAEGEFLQDVTSILQDNLRDLWEQTYKSQKGNVREARAYD